MGMTLDNSPESSSVERTPSTMETLPPNRGENRQDELDTPAEMAGRQVQSLDSHTVRTSTTASTWVDLLGGRIHRGADTAQSSNPIVAKWALEMRTLTDEQRERFLKEVPDGDLNMFANSIEGIVTQRIKSSRTLQVANAMAPLGQLVELTKPFADTVQSAFPPAGLILGGISFLLSMNKKFVDSQESVIRFLQKVLTNHKLFEAFRYTIPDTPEIQLILVEIYGDLLKFLATAVKPFLDKKGRARMTVVPVAMSLWKPFDAEFGNLEKHLDNHLSAFDRALSLHSQKEQTTMSKLQGQTLQMIKGADQRRSLFEKQSGVKETAKEREELRKDILDWIPHISFGHIQDDKHSNSLPATGRWLFDHDSFRTWKDGGPSNLLWITGKAGSGKSHLAAHTIHNIRESCRLHDPLLAGEQDNKAQALAFIYCGSNANAKMSSVTVPVLSVLLGSVLRQLYAQLPKDKNVETIRKRYMESRFDGLRRAEIKDGIRSVVCDFSRVYIIVDGLDECSGLPGDDFKDLCNFFGSLAARELANSTRVAIFSRPGYSAITNALPNPLEIQVDDGSNADDIKTFVQEKTVDLAKRPSALQQIQNNLLNGAEGVFLWVSLSIKIIELETSDRAKMAAAQNTWRGLEGLYSAMLQKVLTQSTSRRDLGLKALLWVANAQEPLSREELVHALSFEPGMQSLDSYDIIDERIILSSCSDLLAMKHDHYELLHFSLAEFLKSDAAAGVIHSKDPRDMEDEPPAVLASLCMGYLLLDEFKKGPVDTLENFEDLVERYPLLRHAALHWGTYLRRSMSPNNLALACDILQNTEARNFAMQVLEFYSGRAKYRIFPRAGSIQALHTIATFGLEELLDRFPGAASDIEAEDGCGWYPIDFAVRFEQGDMVKWLLSHGIVLEPESAGSSADTNKEITQPPKCHLSLVSEAASYSRSEIVSILIAAGVDKEGRDGNEEVAWHHAARHGDLDTAEVLVKSGANPNTRNKVGRTPLIEAAAWADIKMLQRLLNCGADVNMQDYEGMTALHILAVHTKDNTATEKISLLCDHGADIEKQNSESRTPLLIAAGLDNTVVFEALLSKGADLTARDQFGSNILHLTSAGGSHQVLKLLLADRNAGKTGLRDLAVQKDGRGTSPDPLDGSMADMHSLCYADCDGWWPLHSAVAYREIECAEYIYNYDPDQVNKQDSDGYTPLHHAVTNSQMSMVDFLLDRGADINVVRGPTKNQDTPLHLAMGAGLLEIATALLKRGADPNLENEAGVSAWDTAAGRADDTTMRFVLDNDSVLREDTDRLQRLLKSAINFQNIEVVSLLLSPHGQQSLLSNKELNRNCGLWAIRGGSREIWQMLISRDSSLAIAADSDGDGALHYAAMAGRTHFMSQLCEMDVDLNQAGFSNRSPLIWAAEVSMSGIVKFLCGKGVDVNHTDSYGRTALHYSAGAGRRNAMEALLEAGADVCIRDTAGFTAAEYAASSVSVLLEDGNEGLRFSSPPRHIEEAQRAVNSIIRRLCSPKAPSQTALGYTRSLDLGLIRMFLLKTRMFREAALLSTELFGGLRYCDVCEIDIKDPGYYSCAEYFDVDLCASCHNVFTRGGGGGQDELYALEYALRPVRSALLDTSQFGINTLLRVFDNAAVLWGYFEEKNEQYRRWYKRYNIERQQQQETPGALLAWIVIGLKDLSEAGGNDEGAAGTLQDTVRVVAGSEERRLTYNFRFLNRKWSPAREMLPITACSSHKLLKVRSLKELSDEDRAFFDENGTLSNSFLETLGETIANLDIGQLSTGTEHMSGSWPGKTTMDLTDPGEPSKDNVELQLPDTPDPAQAPDDPRQTGHDEEKSGTPGPLEPTVESDRSNAFKIDVDEVRKSLLQKMRRLQPDDDSLVRGEGFVLETAWSLVQAIVYGDEARRPPLVDLVRESGESEGDRVQTA
ncbi:uncharacterized protein PG986_011387 [Apiospora aurea]|uniref:Nephrocystin 3-like N-terminal domain-containing protein n=1 Tax=Apiospora aurea TaxID=335848 RepID=A0ABR1Q5G3_9PEZI